MRRIPSPRPGQHRRAFTIIELLVVISIVTLLISILLPVLSSARDAARSLACSSNQRQTIIAWSMYVHDHDDRIPYHQYTDPDAGFTVIWVSLLGPYLGDPQIQKHAQHVNHFSVRRSTDGILSCPSQQPYPENLVYDNGTTTLIRTSDYGFNQRMTVTGGSDDPSFDRYQHIVQPSRQLVYGETMDWAGETGWYVLFPVSSPGTVHTTWGLRHGSDAGMNTAFADGHVAFTPVQDLNSDPDTPASTNPGRYEPWLSMR